MYRVLTVFAFGVSVLCGTSALAQMPVEKPSLVVHYADLDLTHEEGARALLGRLQHAARVVCNPATGERDLDRIALYRDCLREAMDRAVNDVHAPLVSALYGTPTPTIADKKRSAPPGKDAVAVQGFQS